jgi:molybdopterin-guanine dinucleotide biosynthesis protein A
VIVDALILAGGRSSRLEGSAKQKLRVEGSTLLERSVAAVRGVGAVRVVVIGEDRVDAAVTVRESPIFAGPVAGIAAGLAALTGPPSDALFVIACDMPRIADALPALLTAAAESPVDGVVATDRGRRQQLVMLVAPEALERALAALPTTEGAAVRDLLAGLDLRDVVVPGGSTDDIDTWDDAARFGVVRDPRGASDDRDI